MGRNPRATIIIPTGPNAATVDLAIESALNQTIDDVEIIVVGNGCDDIARTLIDPYWRTDSRVRFMDFPASADGGYEYRCAALGAAHAPMIAYLADTDLLCPDHVVEMSKVLDDADVAYGVAGAFRPDRTFAPAPMARAQALTLIAAPSDGRALTGMAFRSDAVVASTEADDARPELRVSSSQRVTAIVLPLVGDGRAEWTPAERRAEAERWAHTVQHASARGEIDAAVARGLAEWITATTERDTAAATITEAKSWKRWFRRSK